MLGWLYFYREVLVARTRFLLDPFVGQIFRYNKLCPFQLMPVSLRHMMGFVLLCKELGVEPYLDLFFFIIFNTLNLTRHDPYYVVQEKIRFFLLTCLPVSKTGNTCSFLFLETRLKVLKTTSFIYGRAYVSYFPLPLVSYFEISTCFFILFAIDSDDWQTHSKIKCKIRRCYLTTLFSRQRTCILFLIKEPEYVLLVPKVLSEAEEEGE